MTPSYLSAVMRFTLLSLLACVGHIMADDLLIEELERNLAGLARKWGVSDES